MKRIRLIEAGGTQKVEFEYDYDNHTTEFLQSRGLSIYFAPVESGAYAIKRLSNGTFEAAADYKRFPNGGGCAL